MGAAEGDPLKQDDKRRRHKAARYDDELNKKMAQTLLQVSPHHSNSNRVRGAKHWRKVP